VKKASIPRHIAIIMDGNGRWAKKRRLPRTFGHKKGIETAEHIIEAAADHGIKVLTLFAFSTENWKRPEREIHMLFGALENLLHKKLQVLVENKIQLRLLGKMNQFPASLKKTLHAAQQKTHLNKKLIVNLALNYGGRSEIVHAAQEVARGVKSGKFAINDITAHLFSQHLYTVGLPDPDLLIRTSGEQRISNFLLWQLSYAELYFCEKLWPDFTNHDFQKAIEEYQRRERRLGGI